jgi:class 3 adenylate cyclase/CheY-like chemotaxis protein
VSKRLNDLLIGKIRHNLKTHLNIVCGFSELLLEELEDIAGASNDDGLEALASINQSGDSIVQYIDQMFAAHNFSLEDVFAQLNVQAQAFQDCTNEFVAQINEQLAWCEANTPEAFFAEFEEDFRKIERATLALQDNVTSLQSGSIDSIDSLVEHRVLSRDDVNLVGKFSESLEETPDVLETKYPSNILVVDDNPANTEYLRRKLLAAKHSVLVANSGHEAEAILQDDNPVDLVLLDILMPDLSGYDILGRNRDLLQSKNIPVIVVSSLDEQETVYRCLESGAQDFITKPVNFMILAARINSALERKYLLDREEDHLRRIESEKQKNEELLLNILPQPIAQRMKANEYLIADSVSDCSILFGDIVGFTPLSQALGPIKIVDMLNQIFSTFDDFCEELGVEKIKTIGDNYMVACGVPTPDPQHAVKAVTMGERMLRFVEALPDMQGHRIAMRIGVHSGPAVAGVIGKKKFVYDLWGDAVNTAGRMETYGLPNCLHMSDATAELVRDHFELEARGSLDIKGIGDMQTHLLKRRR